LRAPASRPLLTHEEWEKRAEPHTAEENRMSDVPLSGTVLERLSRVEAAIDGLRHSQNLTIGATIGVGAILAAFIIAFGIYGLQRMDALDAKLNARIDSVDAKIDQKFDAFAARFSEESARNRQELTAIGSAITAARQPPPGNAPGPPSPTGGSSSPPAPR
jgi:hypothetical protein